MSQSKNVELGVLIEKSKLMTKEQADVFWGHVLACVSVVSSDELKKLKTLVEIERRHIKCVRTVLETISGTVSLHDHTKVFFIWS